MKTKIRYLNDRKIPAKVGIGTLMNLIEVPPATMKVFEFDLPEGYNFFFKHWENNVVLISMDKNND